MASNNLRHFGFSGPQRRHFVVPLGRQSELLQHREVIGDDAAGIPVRFGGAGLRARAGALVKDTHGPTLRFAPPLVISGREIDWALEQFAVALRE